MDNKYLRAAVGKRLGPHAILAAATFDWFDRLGFKIAGVSDDCSIVYLDVPEIPNFEDDKEREQFINSEGVLKRIKEKFTEALGEGKITFKYRIIKEDNK